MSGFGLGGPGRARRGGRGLAARDWWVACFWIQWQSGRITEWLGAFLVTVLICSLRDRPPALAVSQ